MNKQIVNLGVTLSGARGLFTGGYLAMPLTPEQYDKFSADTEALKAYCARLDFQLKEAS